MYLLPQVSPLLIPEAVSDSCPLMKLIEISNPSYLGSVDINKFG